MTGPTQLSEILRQLGEINNQLGQHGAQLENLREDMQTSSSDAHVYRREMYERVNNTSERLGKVEREMEALKLTIDKTVVPLVRGVNNSNQRRIGFFAAWGMVGVALTTILAFGLENIARALTRIFGH